MAFFVSLAAFALLVLVTAVIWNGVKAYFARMNVTRAIRKSDAADRDLVKAAEAYDLAVDAAVRRRDAAKAASAGRAAPISKETLAAWID